MGVYCVPLDQLPPSKRMELSGKLAAFYRAAPEDYYSTADLNAGAYDRKTLPFHMDLLDRISPGVSVCEVGCGTAHLCPKVEERGGTYLGLDWSEELLAVNAKRFPNARFLQAEVELTTPFDVVVSLYTVEHVADPPAYLQRLWDLCRPGGFVAIICPDFVEGEGLPPSFFYGSTARRLRAKVKKGALVDAARHILDVKLSAPRWKARARNSPPGSFWINLQPRALVDPNYSIDADAVHLSRLKDIVWWFTQKKAVILARSDEMDVPPDVQRYNCYVAARKPHFTDSGS